MKNIINLIPYLLITILCVGGVEFLYSKLEQRLKRLSKEEETAVILEGTGSSEVSGVKRGYNYQVIIDRNLFGGSLKAKETPKEESVSLEELDATLLDIVLLGTITGSKYERRAIILDKSTNNQELYQKGDAIQGAIIKDILRGRVVLNFRGKDEVLNMSTEKDKKSQPVSVNPSPRQRKSLSTPKSTTSRTQPEKKVRKVRPTRKFSYRNRKTQKTNPDD